MVFCAVDSGSRIDYVWADARLQKSCRIASSNIIESTADTPPSDHNPVVTTFRVRAGVRNEDDDDNNNNHRHN